MKTILQILVALIVIVGGTLSAVNYFAKAGDLQLVEMRLEQKIISDQLMDTQRRIWQLEDRYPNQQDCRTWDERDKKAYRELKTTLDNLKDKQKGLLGK